MKLDSRNQQYLSPAASTDLRARCLFYPSAGSDTEVPFATFLPWIDEFWFVDLACDLEKRFTDDYEPVEPATLEEQVGRTGKDKPFNNVIRQERYRVPGRETPVTVRLCRGRGYDVFRYAFLTPRKPISVFFHRGDSQGESGSNFYWLGRKRLRDVIACLEPGGLVVSDGSLAVRQFRAFHRTDTNGSEAMQSAESFERALRSWQCVSDILRTKTVRLLFGKQFHAMVRHGGRRAQGVDRVTYITQHSSCSCSAIPPIASSEPRQSSVEHQLTSSCDGACWR